GLTALLGLIARVVRGSADRDAATPPTAPRQYDGMGCEGGAGRLFAELMVIGTSVAGSVLRYVWKEDNL
ncbi:MAG: hypothetical protein LBH13_00660, partial [Cellulomonadaceae bacterium]|nr:hypothetical protein [Cellulomonadaceae bacterium]